MTVRPANFDPSIDPTADQVRALRDAGPADSASGCERARRLFQRLLAEL
jgi:hypothetical protein